MLPNTKPPARLGDKYPLRFRPVLITCPWIRETLYANTFHIRLKQLSAPNRTASVGPSDLVNWGRYIGERLAKSATTGFGPAHDPGGPKREANGYIGYYHFCNGIDYTQGPVGVELSSGGTNPDKPMLLMHCTYNVFQKAELRTRVNVHVPLAQKPGARSPKPAPPAEVSVCYSVHYCGEPRTADYTPETIHELDAQFWVELAALSLVRAVLRTDYPDTQACGTVNLSDMVVDASALAQSVQTLVARLPRGHMAGTRESYGPGTSSGTGTGLRQKPAMYRNRLVDTLVRVCSLDAGGRTADRAIAEIRRRYGHDYDYVVCQLLKTQRGRNNTTAFLAVIRDYLERDALLCHAALLLVEQSRFLVGQGSISHAQYVAARAVDILPLDFDSWHQLALCYVLGRAFSRALDIINLMCQVLGQNDASALDFGAANDPYALRWTEHASQGKFIDLHTFERFFPAPVDDTNTNMASMARIWHKTFHYNPNTRRPILGVFCTSSLALASPLEASSVAPELQDVIGPNSAKMRLAAASLRQPYASVLDYEHRSPWGRIYDLLTMVVALIGWDNTLDVRAQVFGDASDNVARDSAARESTDARRKASKPICRMLLQLFLVVYDDLAAMTALDPNEHRSALAWGTIGFAGWGCKYNLRETLSALITSTLTCTEGRFLYFPTIKLLHICRELVLSDVTSSALDPYADVCSGAQHTNKLILLHFLPQVYADFAALLEAGYFSLEHVLVYIVKTCSWHVRWYQYMPSDIVVSSLQRLCAKYENAVVRETLRVVFEKLRKGQQKLSGAFNLKEMFASPRHERQEYEFEDSDTVAEYIECLLDWLALLGTE
ncbi:hypothetical protein METBISCDRAFT_15194 [Metschnikowia bicuspidata]|uniref:Uncharacterized protein n=1 Tax=Metschnikowia bicuspidata TaxID=27322 RepID=A0A4P9ZDB7_9ASCO|nr:hypothetical protein METBISCDRAFT_15194 [Metschnikowia bicuspidata]